ncbi:MAG TPA: phosphoglycerate mutase family protein [Xanthomonadaceae bacterium]|nr:phosphoglycerate mutase family protein [Xanthomonadaceae bacterium]
MSLRSVLAVLLLAGTGSAAVAEPSLVIVVRHAEKASGPGVDPGLSATGQARASALADVLADGGIDAILTTQYRRTRDTAAVLAQQLGIVPGVIDARRGDTATHVAEVADAVRAESGRVLVVGHSNTVARIVVALGGPDLPDLCETSYGHAFVLVPGPDKASLLRLRYGTADPPAGEGCL